MRIAVAFTWKTVSELYLFNTRLNGGLYFFTDEDLVKGYLTDFKLLIVFCM